MLQWLLKIDRLVLRMKVLCLRMYSCSCADCCPWGAEHSLYRQNLFTKRVRSKKQDWCANLWERSYRTAVAFTRCGSVRWARTVYPGNDKALSKRAIIKTRSKVRRTMDAATSWCRRPVLLIGMCLAFTYKSHATDGRCILHCYKVRIGERSGADPAATRP